MAGPPEHGHVWIRDQAFAAAGRRFGLEARIVHTDFSGEEGAAATRELLGTEEGRPTAIIYDNDLMAVAGLSVVNELGLKSPDDVTLVAGDDSTLCRLTHPTMTAMSHNIVAYGAEVTHRLFNLLDGALHAAHLYSTPALVVRGSSGSPSARPVARHEKPVHICSGTPSTTAVPEAGWGVLMVGSAGSSVHIQCPFGSGRTEGQTVVLPESATQREPDSMSIGAPTIACRSVRPNPNEPFRLDMPVLISACRCG